LCQRGIAKRPRAERANPLRIMIVTDWIKGLEATRLSGVWQKTLRVTTTGNRKGPAKNNAFRQRHDQQKRETKKKKALGRLGRRTDKKQHKGKGMYCKRHEIRELESLLDWGGLSRENVGGKKYGVKGEGEKEWGLTGNRTNTFKMLGVEGRSVYRER